MFVAFVHDLDKYGVLLCSHASREYAITQLQVSGDLLFNDDGVIDQGQDWPMGEYARRQQKDNLNVSNYHWIVRK